MSMNIITLFIIDDCNNGHSYNNSDNYAYSYLWLSHNNNGCNNYYNFINYHILFNLLLLSIQK